MPENPLQHAKGATPPGFFSMRTLTATCAACISGCTVHPIDFMRIRMERQGEGVATKAGAEHRNVFHGFRNVYKKEGLRSFS